MLANAEKYDCFAEAFAVCEDYSPPEGFSEKDLYRLLKEIGSPSGADDLGKHQLFVICLNDACYSLKFN